MNSNSRPSEMGETSGAPVDLSSLISPMKLKALNAGMLLTEHPDPDALSLAPWFLASLSLPYRDPGAALNAWVRENGNLKITVTPHIENGESRFPYGVIPRLLLTWMTTEAIRTGSPEIQIAKTLNRFLGAMGIGDGGTQRKRALDQMQRLFNAGVRIEQHEKVERDGENLIHKTTKNFQFAEGHELWLKADIGQASSVEWGSTVTLSPKFYESIKEHSFPVYTEAIKALGNSPLRLDIYLFMVNRYFRLKRPTRISWDQLNSQFGGNYAESRQFKHAFIKHLDIVSAVYPEAKYVVSDKFLMLLPSPQHIPSIPDSAEVLGSLPS